MPRSRSIDWKTRVQVFLWYRRLKNKIYPTAKRFGFARSTVSNIVEEFKKAGFSMTHRSNLPRLLLLQAQELHLEEVLAERRKSSRISITEPGRKLRSVLELGDQTEEDGRSSYGEGVLMDESLVWHLKGTSAEETLSGCRDAIIDYDRQCLSLWDDIASGLEDKCGLPLGSVRDWDGVDQSPRVFDKLVDRVYGVMFSTPSDSTSPPSNWFRCSENQSGLLEAGHEWAASGTPEERERVKNGLDAFLANHFAGYHLRAMELQRLRHDLGYIVQILEKALNGVSDEELEDGVCPECPYPEFLLEL